MYKMETKKFQFCTQAPEPKAAEPKAADEEDPNVTANTIRRHESSV